MKTNQAKPNRTAMFRLRRPRFGIFLTLLLLLPTVLMPRDASAAELRGVLDGQIPEPQLGSPGRQAPGGLHAKWALADGDDSGVPLPDSDDFGPEVLPADSAGAGQEVADRRRRHHDLTNQYGGQSSDVLLLHGAGRQQSAWI